MKDLIEQLRDEVKRFQEIADEQGRFIESITGSKTRPVEPEKKVIAPEDQHQANFTKWLEERNFNTD